MISPRFGGGRDGGCGGGGDDGDDVDVYDDGDADRYCYGIAFVLRRIRVKPDQTWMQRRPLTVNASCHCHDWKTSNSLSTVF